MKKRYVWLIVLAMLLLVIVLPYARVELLSTDAEQKLASFDLSCYENVYCEGIPKVYDCKIYSYRAESSAKVFYVLGECEFGMMVQLKWDEMNACWEHVSGQVMWSSHGGNAREFYWPLYYADMFFSWLED